MRIKPKKSLGQNFLVDQNIQRKIILACELKSSDIVLEIGAGKGELTHYIAERVDRVYAIEIDSRLCQFLKAQFTAHPNARLINQDILKLNLRQPISNGVSPVRDTELTNRENKISNGLKVIGNIPYYITTPILEHLLKFRDKIEKIFISVQKEFAQRIIAKPGSKDYGAFSCFMQYYTEPKVIFTIKKTSFLPAPKVDSCFLRLDIKRKLPLRVEEESSFFKLIRTAFHQRRKTLKNSLKDVILPENLEAFFKKYNIASSIRPEDLSLEDFANLMKS